MRHLLLRAALLLITAQSVVGIACDFHNTTSLTACIKGILTTSRPGLRKLIDPLLLNDMNGTGVITWKVTGARIHGLGSYNVERFVIVHSAPLLLTVKFGVAWRRLLGTGAGWFRICGQLLGSTRCVSFTARPRVHVKDLVASMKTHLHMSFQEGRLKVKPQDTEIDISIPNIRVEVNLDGFLGVLDRLLQRPSDKYAKKLATEWWTANKKTLLKTAKEQLHQLVDVYLSPELETLIQGIAQ